MVLHQHVPDVSEATAVEPLIHPIGKSDPQVLKSFTHNTNPDILFKHPEDRHMSHLLSEALDRLAPLVSREWPGIELRVTATWDPTGTGHHEKSLHYEGRATDLTTSDRSSKKLGKLADLAVQAGFGWVLYEDLKHVHASVKRSW